MRTGWAGTCALAVVAAVAAGCSAIDNNVHVDGVKAVLGGSPEWVERSALGKRLWEIERAFYESRQHVPAWVDGDRTTPHMKDLVEQLRYSARHGLEPAAYGVAEFDRLREESQTRFRGTRFDPAVVPELDTKLTYAYLRYAADLLGWSSTPRDLDRNWRTTPRADDLAARLARAVDGTRVRDTLEELAPAHSQYKGLQAALLREEQNPTGRADALRMNLERWRWAPRDLGERHILINVPTYQLQVVEGEDPVLAMRVIVGEPDTPTPIFSDAMTYVVFSPYWNIPESILREETLPRVAQNPAYLARNNLEVVRDGEVVDPAGFDWSDEAQTSNIRLRQAPGPENALGLVKFIFPNNFSVYLHDTPGDRLFARERRTFSHGCIRVEDPVGLARYVLSGRPEWTEERILAAMRAHREQVVTLKQPIPVHIGYWTAWVQPDGATVTYADDPYGLDAKQAARRQAS